MLPDSYTPVWADVEPMPNFSAGSIWTAGARYCFLTNKHCESCDNSKVYGFHHFGIGTKKCSVPRYVELALKEGVKPGLKKGHVFDRRVVEKFKTVKIKRQQLKTLAANV